MVAGALMRGGNSAGAAREGCVRALGAAAGAPGASAGAGEGDITASVAGGGAGARALGGSNSRVYSLTRRPLAQVASTITSTNGSSTTRSLVTRNTERPPARVINCTLAEGNTGLYSMPAAR